MFSDPLRIADAVDNPKFRAGPHKYMRGVFLNLNNDVEWAAIQETNGAISSHPVEWMIAA
jgi:hypothetical protein